MARERVVGYLDSELYPEWQEIVAHRGGESAAVGWVIYEEILRKRGHATKDDKLNLLVTQQAEILRKIDVMLLLAWRDVKGGKVEFTIDDVRNLRDLVAEIQL